ncbi:hypothetical protein ACFLZY_01915 [Patescibacteria group bacterium]
MYKGEFSREHLDQIETSSEPIEGFLHSENIENFITQNEKKFDQMNFQVEIDPDRTPIKTLGNEILAIPVLIDHLDNQADSEPRTDWIVASIKEQKIKYRLQANNRLIAEYNLPNKEAFELKQILDRSQKKVTARDISSYPYEFLLPYEEVWPKEAEILVVGDPYQRCDRDRVTLIDYEYADEIMPDLINWIASQQNQNLSHEDLTQRMRFFFDDLHTGDNVSLEYIYGPYMSDLGNPYKYFVDTCLQTAVSMIEAYAQGNFSCAQAESRVNQLQQEYISLREGDWEIKTYLEQTKDDPEAEKSLRDYYELKEYAKKPEPKKWQRYQEEWEDFLQNIPAEIKTKAKIETEEKRVRYWLNELKEITGPLPERLQQAIGQMQGLYREIITKIATLPEFRNHFQEIPYNETISDTFNKGLMSDSVFGVVPPGMPLPKRADQYLGEAVDFNQRLAIYLEKILPVLMSEEERLYKSGINFDLETVDYYTRGLEKAMIKEKMHRKRTQAATVTHGFFPDDAKGMKQQDRILALYSVSTHVWNTYNQPQQFQTDIEKTIEMLKPKGKYIVGPISYAAYHVWSRSGKIPEGIAAEEFAGSSLRQACENLKQTGKIDYFFTKVNDPEAEEDCTQTTEFDNGAIAGSLVITKK